MLDVARKYMPMWYLKGHPKIVGGSISLWNDRGIFNGISVYDGTVKIMTSHMTNLKLRSIL